MQFNTVMATADGIHRAIVNQLIIFLKSLCPSASLHLRLHVSTSVSFSFLVFPCLIVYVFYLCNVMYDFPNFHFPFLFFFVSLSLCLTYTHTLVTHSASFSNTYSPTHSLCLSLYISVCLSVSFPASPPSLFRYTVTIWPTKRWLAHAIFNNTWHQVRLFDYLIWYENHECDRCHMWPNLPSQPKYCLTTVSHDKNYLGYA